MSRLKSTNYGGEFQLQKLVPIAFDYIMTLEERRRKEILYKLGMVMILCLDEIIEMPTTEPSTLFFGTTQDRTRINFTLKLGEKKYAKYYPSLGDFIQGLDEIIFDFTPADIPEDEGEIEEAPF